MRCELLIYFTLTESFPSWATESNDVYTAVIIGRVTGINNVYTAMIIGRVTNINNVYTVMIIGRVTDS